MSLHAYSKIERITLATAFANVVALNVDSETLYMGRPSGAYPKSVPLLLDFGWIVPSNSCCCPASIKSNANTVEISTDSDDCHTPSNIPALTNAVTAPRDLCILALSCGFVVVCLQVYGVWAGGGDA